MSNLISNQIKSLKQSKQMIQLGDQLNYKYKNKNKNKNDHLNVLLFLLF